MQTKSDWNSNIYHKSEKTGLNFCTKTSSIEIKLINLNEWHVKTIHRLVLERIVQNMYMIEVYLLKFYL